MINLAEIKREAAVAGVDVAVIEKDYVLSWVLKGIFESAVADVLVFKGGTAMRKAYFKGYRFSEDLDFTISKPVELAFLEASIAEVCLNVRVESGLELTLVNLKQTRKELGAEAFEGKVQYVGPRQHRGNPGRIKLDLTAYEQILLPKIDLPLIHGYSDQCQAAIATYQLDEILAEKLRTIIQRAYPRDLHDVWYILKFHEDKINPKTMIETYRRKCDYKNVGQVDWELLFQSQEIVGKETAFSNSLGRQLKELPPFSELISELAFMVTGIFSRSY